MQVDIIGIENVLKYIESTKKTKFSIYRATGTNGAYMPVFECLESDTNANAVSKFRDWAEVVNNNVPYKLIVYDFAEVTIAEDGTKKIKKASERNGKMESVFILNNTFTQGQQANQQNQNNSGGYDLAALRESIVSDLAKKHEESAILKEIAELRQRFLDMDAEEEEEEEPDNSIAGIQPDQIAQIMGLVNMFKSQAPAVLNGTEEQGTRTENINKAIKLLYKHDKQLDTDLLKLAEIAETKTETFNMLITTLRSM
jgi:hypothetical protein